MKRETLFVFSIFLVTVFGYGIPFLLPYLLCGSLLLSPSVLMYNIKKNAFFVVSLLLLVLFGFLNIAFSLSESDSLSVITWIAFVVFPILVFSNADIESFSDEFEKIIMLLFLMDLITNLLLMVTPLPWAKLPEIRPDEMFPRFPGFKGSQLFSGYLSLVTSCLFIERFSEGKKYKLFFFLALFNLLLAGSFRFYAILIFIFVLKFFETKIILANKTHWAFILFVVCVVVATFLTKDISGSNYLRCLFWQDSFQRMLDAPLIGNGFFILRLEEFNDFDTLKAAGNTESCMLSIGINFGLVVLLLLIIGILAKMRECDMFSKYLALLIVEAGLLCFGGGNTNILDGTVLGLSLVCISNNCISYDISSNSII